MASIIPVAGTPGLQNIEGEYIALKPLCEALGVDSKRQTDKIKSTSWAVAAEITATGSDGETYRMTGLHKDSVPMWLATISENQVEEEARPILIAYQKEAAKALNDYFTKGAAVGPNIVTDYKAQAEILNILKDILPKDRLESKAEIIMSRAMGDTPEISPKDIPLYVDVDLQEYRRNDFYSMKF